MYDAGPASQSDIAADTMQRVNGVARVRFGVSGGDTRLADLYQSGSAKIRLPKVYGEPRTAVLINTAGGLTGGDRLTFDVAVGDAGHAIVTSQTAERAYRSTGGSAEVTGRFAVGAGATLEWLPQETILFDASRLTRSMEADLGEDARLMMLETVILGRTAMGEKIHSVFFRDRWRIRRSGRLVFADDIRLDGIPDKFLAGPATGNGALAFATLVECAPDAEDRLPLARASMDEAASVSTKSAVSSWNGLLVARFVSHDSRDLRNTLIRFLTGYRAAGLPRVWHC
ncbi:urease accessory protein UreD [Roseibium sp.]|uniref:urease accessory protein UreD n=1 Tax=Roseibium sp. TaxID=1936156 RepID=UPI003D140960